VIHNGIDCTGYQPVPPAWLREKLGISPEAILIGAVGALSPQKGMDLLIRAVAKLERANVHLAIAGDGPERAQLHALAAALGVRERTHFLGYCSDIAPLYAASDIAALASRAEAFGMALAEAGLFCLPVVSCRVQGVPEVVEDRKTGILVPPNDVDAFANALAQLCDQPQMRQRMGLAGNIRTRQLFDVERMTRNFEALYDELMDQPMRPLAPFPYFSFLLKASAAAARQNPTRAVQ
jgi:glycosyltransferase involved in cell wall biosynthesis